jgi:ribonuclease G
LKRILRELAIPDGMGVIMRTAGEGKQARYFVRDLALLLEEWRGIQDKIKSRACHLRVPGAGPGRTRTVRDFLTEDVERIVVDSQKASDRITEMIGQDLPPLRAQGEGLQRSRSRSSTGSTSPSSWRTPSQRQVHLKSGGYIVIDETEALVAIDVNTGKHKAGKDQEARHPQGEPGIGRRNLPAVAPPQHGRVDRARLHRHEIGADQQAVYSRMKDGLRRDKAKTHILPISQLGLMEMTRQRHSESVRSAVYDDCPYCKGRGRSRASRP